MKIKSIVFALLIAAALFCFAASAQADNVEKLDIAGMEGWHIEDAYINDGYVLVKAANASGAKLVLLPLDDPDGAVSLDIGGFNGIYSLLDGGNVLNTDWEGRFILYDNLLNETCRQDKRCGVFLGASDDGDVWYFTADSAFALYRHGELTATVPANGVVSGSYAGTEGSKAYFAMYDNEGNSLLKAIDLGDFTLSGVNTLPAKYEVRGGRISYASEDYWYTASLSNPVSVTVFTKPYSNATVFTVDENLLISEKFEYDSGSYTDGFYVYDMNNGGLCDEKSVCDFGAEYASLLGCDGGAVLIKTNDKNMENPALCLWNVRGVHSDEPAKVYKTLDFDGAADRVDAIVREIEFKYGVKVYYDREHLKQYANNYILTPCADRNKIGCALIMLKQCMAEYPKGLFREMTGSNHSETVFCLVDSHTRTDEYSIDDAVGTVNEVGNALRMTLDVNQWMGFRRIFLHENMHMMEFRVGEEMPKIANGYYVTYWYDVLDGDCPPIQQYIWERTDENMKGVYDRDPENARYIDWYSKCTISEDEARTLENSIYSAALKYYTSPNIDRKSRFLLGMIREAFPCVKNSDTPVFWEVRTGIVNLKEEFPDFADKNE